MVQTLNESSIDHILDLLTLLAEDLYMVLLKHSLIEMYKLLTSSALSSSWPSGHPACSGTPF